jgi:hypothetical protein
LNEDRVARCYCNKCGKEYAGCSVISYENPNEKVGEGIIPNEE